MKQGDPVRVAAGIALIAGALAGGAPSRAQPVPEAVTEGQTPEDEQRAVWDPWQPMNRAFFAFNEFVDRWLLEPVAAGWDVVVPDPAQRGIANFFANAATPRRVANDLIQGKLDKAGDDLGRFAINTTFGVLGLFDPAGAEGIAPGDEDFGQTLGVWGTPAGPYLVLPLLGPSSPRDAVGLAVDGAAAPEFYFAPWYVSYPITGTRVINARSLVLETVRAEREAAFDFYSAVRSAYVQYRANQVRDRVVEPEGEDVDEGLYDLEEEE
ncbi:MAG: MlaA family lipoprotein [Myxococcota bacterium]